jgi:hypothetical protein
MSVEKRSKQKDQVDKIYVEEPRPVINFEESFSFNVEEISPFKSAYKNSKSKQNLAKEGPYPSKSQPYKNPNFYTPLSRKVKKRKSMLYGSNKMVEPKRITIKIQGSKDFPKSGRKQNNLHNPYLPYEKKIVLKKSKFAWKVIML